MLPSFNFTKLKVALSLVLSLAVFTASAQLKRFQLEQLDSLQKMEKRAVVVFIGTSWCKYCQNMEQTTFKNREVEKIINNNFYFVSLNAEDKKDIFFQHRIFKFKPTGSGTGINELAEELANVKGTITYPTLCFLNAKNEILYQQTGYIAAADLKKILKHLQ